MQVLFAMGVLLFVGGAQSVYGQSEAFAARDKQYRYGRILYDFVRKEHGQDWVERHELIFDAKGSYRERLLSNTSKAEGAFKNYDCTKDGNSQYAVIDQGKGSSLVWFGASGPWPVARSEFFNVLEYPCFALGLGFGSGQPSGGSASEKGSTVVQEGTSTFEITTDPAHAGEPTQIKRLGHGKLINEWHFYEYRKVSDGLRLPFLIHESSKVSDKESEYHLISADFEHRPTEQDMQAKWFKPGAEVEDYRVSPVADWTYEELLSANDGSTVMTSEKLLKLSMQRSKNLADAELRSKKLQAYGLFVFRRARQVCQ